MVPEERSGVAWPESLAKATAATDATAYELMAAPAPTENGERACAATDGAIIAALLGPRSAEYFDFDLGSCGGVRRRPVAKNEYDDGRCQKGGPPIRPRRDQTRSMTREHDARHEALVALPTRALRRLRREGSRPTVIVCRPRVEDIVGVMIAKGRSRVWRLCVAPCIAHALPLERP
jgi:hypothetical protein